ncbi:MAG: DUF99 family protein [Candidatus Bathyarchaeia archaeon]
MSPGLSKSTSRHRIVGVDDGAFQIRRGAVGTAVIVAVLFQGCQISATRIGRIEVDGTDANSVLIALLKTLAYDVVMLSGISFGGFNLVDIKRLSRETGKPVIVVIGGRPNNTAVQQALRGHFEDWKRRWQTVRNAGSLYSCRPLVKEPKVYFEVKGCSPSFARKLITSSSMISRLPEPIRVAGLLARGLATLVG